MRRSKKIRFLVVWSSRWNIPVKTQPISRCLPYAPRIRRQAKKQNGADTGLERVAEELMGRREWTSYQEIMVGQESKGGEPVCPAPLRQPPHIPLPVREGSRSPMTGGWYIRPASPEPQPLDLSSKTPKPPNSPSKTIFKAKPRLPGVGGRRSYTEDELQAALRDIQSGKLGTRRAAVIYGIPRSTLRNKVYKISQETRDFEEEEEEETSGAEEERETELILNSPLSVHDILRLSSARATWPCLQQLLSGASTSSEELPARGFPPAGPRNGEGTTPPPPPPQPTAPPKEQPLDFRRNHNNNNNNSTSTNNNNNNHLEDKKNQSKQQQGGKGTRPKRGKYRNYDRDSLVEAVRAVQRGEMSVHRAGSYYGVPHSTLEYKVKERHLMRPRKREPKPQPPPDDKRKEEEKRLPPVARTTQLTPPLANGLKHPLFEPSLQFRAPFAPYWQPPFPLFGRPELFPAEATARRPDESTVALSKTAREMAESLLENAESGSFLDGIIRSSLDTGLPQRESGGKVLLEQLCRGTQIEKTPPPPSPAPPSSPPQQPPSPPKTPLGQSSDGQPGSC